MNCTSIGLAMLLSAGLPITYAADTVKPAMPGVGQEAPLSQTAGAAIYEAVCQACHMPEGAGATGAGSYPPLARNQHLKPKAFPIILVLNGSRAMPPFKEMLTDEQVAAVVSYVRTHFGNHFNGRVCPDDVRALRP